MDVVREFFEWIGVVVFLAFVAFGVYDFVHDALAYKAYREKAIKLQMGETVVLENGVAHIIPLRHLKYYAR